MKKVEAEKAGWWLDKSVDSERQKKANVQDCTDMLDEYYNKKEKHVVRFEVSNQFAKNIVFQIDFLNTLVLVSRYVSHFDLT